MVLLCCLEWKCCQATANYGFTIDLLTKDLYLVFDTRLFWVQMTAHPSRYWFETHRFFTDTKSLPNYTQFNQCAHCRKHPLIISKKETLTLQNLFKQQNVLSKNWFFFYQLKFLVVFDVHWKFWALIGWFVQSSESKRTFHFSALKSNNSFATDIILQNFKLNNLCTIYRKQCRKLNSPPSGSIVN